MLPCGRLDAHAAAHHMLDVGTPLRLPLILVVVHGIAVRVLVLQTRDRACAKDVHLAKENLGILMCDGLIIAREVEINIRNLVPVKSEEDGERNIVPVLRKRRTADGTVQRRQIKAAPDGAVVNEFVVLTVTAAIVGRQRVDLSDADHGRDKGRSDRTARADQVTVVVRLFHKALCDNVECSKTIAQDRFQLEFEAIGYDLRQILTVELTCARVGHFLDLSVRARHRRRIEFVGDRKEVLHHIGDLPWICDDALVGTLRTEIVELGKHFVRRAQIERRLSLGITVAVRFLQHGAVDGILWIEEVHVAGRNQHFIEFFGKRIDFAVDVPQIFIRVNGETIVNLEEVVVVNRLDLEEVIKLCDFLQLLVGPPRDDTADQFARLARRADNDPRTVLLQHGAGNTWTTALLRAAEVADM